MIFRISPALPKNITFFNRRRRVSINAPNSSTSSPCALSLGQDSVGLSKSSTEEESMLCKLRVCQSLKFQGLVNADACRCHDQVNRIKCMESRNSHKILQNDKVHTDLCQLLHRIVLFGVQDLNPLTPLYFMLPASLF